MNLAVADGESLYSPRWSRDVLFRLRVHLQYLSRKVVEKKMEMLKLNYT